MQGFRFSVAVFGVGLFVGVGFGEGLGGAPVGSFSVVALPDTQAYSANQPAVFYAETQWIVDNVARQRIVFVSHVGDVVDRDVPAQWAVAVRAMSKLDGKVAYGISVGNHDMKCSAGDASLFSTMFPAKRFEKEKWYGGFFKDNVNSFQTFEAQGLRFVILHLEL